MMNLESFTVVANIQGLLCLEDTLSNALVWVKASTGHLHNPDGPAVYNSTTGLSQWWINNVQFDTEEAYLKAKDDYEFIEFIIEECN